MGRLSSKIALTAALLAVGVGAGGVAYLFALRSTRGTALTIVQEWSREDLVAWGIAVVVLPTVAFAAVTALLVHAKLIGAKGVATTDPGLAFKTLETYAWNLADAVPVLKVPQTLAWKPELRLNTTSGGAIVLLHKLMLVLPLVQLVAVILARSFGDENPIHPLRTPARWRRTTDLPRNAE